MDYGLKIKAFAKQKFKTNKALAKAMDVTETDLSRYIKMKVEPGAKFFVKLRKVGCDINWLLSDKEIVAEPKTHYHESKKMGNVNYSEMSDEEIKQKFEEKDIIIEALTNKIKTLEEGKGSSSLNHSNMAKELIDKIKR